jgi:penicillin-binding protein-related factor A (putative recombinase)
MPSKNDGTAAESAFETLIKADDLYRFPDKKALTGLNGGRPVGAFRQPSDYLVTKGGSTWYAEVKSTQSATSFPFGDIQPSQRAKALKMAIVGGRYDFHIFSFGLGQWFLMSCAQFAAAVAAGAKSIKFKELASWIP